MKKIAIALGLASTSIYQVANAELFIDDSSANPNPTISSIASGVETIKNSAKESSNIVSTAKNYVIKEHGRSVESSKRIYKEFNPNEHVHVSEAKTYTPSVNEHVQEKKSKKTSKVKQEQRQNKVSYQGKGEIVKGFANNLAIKDIIEQIVPSGWKVEVSDRVNLSQKVSFKGGRPWDSILNEISYNRFNTYISFSDKKVTIKPKVTVKKEEVKQKAKANVAEYAKKETRELKNTSRTRFIYDPSSSSKVSTVVPQTVARSENTHITTREYKTFTPSVSTSTSSANVVVKNHNKSGKISGVEYTQIKQKTWLLSKKLTLKENIEAWAKKEGWTVAWKAPDYNVIADARFTGELDSEDGPIISILKNYEDSNLPLKINILGGNKVIHVESRNYLPKDVVDLSL